MKKTFLAVLIVLLCFSFADAQQVMIMKKKAAAGTTWMYPNDIESFPDTSNNIANYLAIITTIAADASVTITKLSWNISDPQTATECVLGLYDNQSSYVRLAYCTISSPTAGWNECTISQAVTATNTYHQYAQCNQGYKTNRSDTACTAKYYNAGGYSSTPPSPIAASNDSGCTAQRMGY